MPSQVAVRSRFVKLSMLSTLAFAALLLPATAQAEEPGIDPTGKGITGGALLGGELVMGLEAAFGVQATWAYVAGGLGGAAAGGVGGYFIEQGDSPKPSYYMLAAGMALLIPTTVAVLQATSYKPPADYTVDQPGAGTAPAPQPAGPVQQPGATVDVTLPSSSAAPITPTTGAQASRPAARPYFPLSLVDLYGGTMRMGVPAVEIRPTYSVAELKKYGVEQHTELRVPVFQATF